MVLDKTIGVACAPARAYALLARPERAPEWQPWTSRAQPDGASRFLMVHDVCGLRLAWRGRADADPVSRVTFEQLDGDFEAMDGEWTVTPDGDGCRVRLRMHVALPFVLPKLVTEPQIARSLSTSLDEALYNLKTLLEEATPLRERAGAGLPRAWPAAVAAAALSARAEDSSPLAGLS